MDHPVIRRRVSWADLDRARLALGKPQLSRAELCRRAGVSESTVTKGLADASFPQKETRKKIELVLEAERHVRAAGLV